MRIVIGGASGFLGSRLTDHLEQAGHDVIRLVRRSPSGPDESRWDPYAGTLDAAVIEAADVVVNLAGSPTAGNPHSRRWADNLLNSRVTTTRTLARAVAGSTRKPALLAGNGISFYGDRGATPLTERTRSHGDALLTRVTRRWQAATRPASNAGARVCILRTSPVLDRANPPLKQLLLPFRLGLGVRLGDGSQYFPVISLRDWLGAVTFAAEHSSLAGPVNLCCPVTPTNAEFTEALADAVGRRSRLAVPSAVLRPAAGQMAPELLDSRNTRPQALLDAGYTFADRDIRDVLAAALA